MIQYLILKAVAFSQVCLYYSRVEDQLDYVFLTETSKQSTNNKFFLMLSVRQELHFSVTVVQREPPRQRSVVPYWKCQQREQQREIQFRILWQTHTSFGRTSSYCVWYKVMNSSAFKIFLKVIFPEQIEITVASKESLPAFQGQVFLFLGSYSLKLNTYKFLLIFFSALILCSQK